MEKILVKRKNVLEEKTCIRVIKFEVIKNMYDNEMRTRIEPSPEELESSIKSENCGKELQ